MITTVEKEPVPRKRRVISQVAQACLRCRQKKVKCSGEKPACQACLNNNVECVWPDRPNMRGKRSSPSFTNHLSTKVGSITGQQHTHPELDTINLQIPSYFPVHSFSNTVSPSSAESMEFPLPITSLEDQQKQLKIPSNRKLLQMWEIFLKTSYTELYGIFNKPSITSQISKGTVHPLLALCICAHAARFSQEEINTFKSPSAASEYYAKNAFSLLSFQLQDISLINISALLMLCLIELGAGRSPKAWLLLGMALRMADSLDLGNDFSEDSFSSLPDMFNWAEGEQRRRTYWSCFMIERLLATGFMAPSKLRTISLNPNKTSIQLPCPEANFCFSQPVVTEFFDGSIPQNTFEGQSPNATSTSTASDFLSFTMGSLIRLSDIWSDISRWVLRGGYSQDIVPPWMPQSLFQQKLAVLENWSKNLSPRLSLTDENYSIYSAPGDCSGGCFIFMHILFHVTNVYLLRNALDLFPTNVQKSDLFASVSERYGQAVPTSWIETILTRVINSANIITRLSIEPLNYAMTPFFGFSVLTASTIHMLNKFCIQNANNEFLDALQFSRIDYLILRERSKYWTFNKGMLQTFKMMYNYYRFHYVEKQPFVKYRIPGFPASILEYGTTMEDSNSPLNREFPFSRNYLMSSNEFVDLRTDLDGDSSIRSQDVSADFDTATESELFITHNDLPVE
ncbi:DNA-binding transcription factor, zf-fungal binuclear cluster type Mca1 [Schizosaccharomyces osmophilus]|uniref:DNA-binding transcription factor, zf-fungal binuclear cluster type Mca1 n=1 Tax=Schizosaccharomyces osmophilus TaxID=2545709 RepID=A0AAE9W9I8_9SCHI|nr:DNA-binding transcription factor, zf-fungal binuclear cluster type Mca1 [Schizosaccharomyces osmophilus]WBW71292.1 DNA-binding transcription factor, zf-fungal binuclear cluster type Mca1 [Schizosaccharomyces osmophilus]